MTTLAREVKNLGCWFDRYFKMDTHINNIYKAAFFQLFKIRRIRKFLSMECTKILVNAFMTSRLDYCNSLLHVYGLPNNQLHKSTVCKMQLQVSSAMLVDSIILLLLCTVSTGYPLSTEYSLKFYFLFLKLLRTFAPIVSAHPYCARKFMPRHAWARAH